MKVKELMDALSKLDPEHEVYMAFQYKDWIAGEPIMEVAQDSFNRRIYLTEGIVDLGYIATGEYKYCDC